MFTIISKKTEINKCHLEFWKQLDNYSTVKMRVHVGYKGENILRDVSYSSTLGIWWTYDKLSNRHWNSFGIGKPQIKGSNSITCEINYPINGVNARIAGGFAKNEVGEVIVIHSGRIGGGKEGIGKTLFTKNFVGETLEVLGKNSVLKYASVSSFTSARFGYQVALFVKEIARIKELIKIKPFEVPGKDKGTKIKTTFNDEFWGKKRIRWTQSGVSICDHGLIVHSLKEILQEKGLNVANNQLRDLYIFNDDKISTVFEIKTDTGRQDVYGGIGQLFLNNVGLKPTPKLILSLPIGLTDEIKEIISRLGIEILEYKWVGKNSIKFLELERIVLNN